MFAMLVIVPLLVAAVLAVMFNNKMWVRYAALLASIVSLLMIMTLSVGTQQSVTWFSFNGFSFNLSVSTAQLNMLLLYLVGIITPLIFLYSAGFMEVPSEQGRYYAEISVFAAAMMLFAMSASFLTMFIGWELLGITSYLLIGFWYRRSRAGYAARKAISTIIIGDILMFIAILLIWASYHSFEFSVVLQSAPTPSLLFAAIMIMLAAFTKSAQFPFHQWLPDAMEGPTPVSAFLHSSTMVKAGVFLIAVLLPIYSTLHLLNIILIFGLASALLGATNALTENHIKKILAYSTTEDLGLMFVALGLGSLTAAMLLFFVQTFYKALLFMDAGAVMRANGGEEDISKLSSLHSGKALFAAMAIGALSLAGLAPFSGFIGKLAVDSAAEGTIPVFALLAVIDLLSSIYIFRWLLVPRHSKGGASVSDGFRTTPSQMRIPIYILAFLVIAAGAGYLYLPAYIPQYSAAQFQISPIGAGTETGIVVLGLIVSYLIYHKVRRFSLARNLRPLYVLIYNSILVNRLYVKVADFTALFASQVDRLDFGIYRFIRAVGSSVLGFANLVRRVESGQVNIYLAMFVIGVLAVIAFFAM